MISKTEYFVPEPSSQNGKPTRRLSMSVPLAEMEKNNKNNTSRRFETGEMTKKHLFFLT